MSMTRVKVKPNQSLGYRIKKLEEKVDDAEYKLDRFETEVGADVIAAITSKLGSLEERSDTGLVFVRERVITIEQQLDMLVGSTNMVQEDWNKGKATLKESGAELKELSQNLSSMGGVLEDVQTQLRVESNKRAKQEETAVQRATLLMRSLAETVRTIIVSQEFKTIQGHMTLGANLSYAAGQMEQAVTELTVGTLPERRATAMEQAAWSLHKIIVTDDEAENVLEQAESPGNAADDSSLESVGGDAPTQPLLRDVACPNGLFELKQQFATCRLALTEALREKTNPAMTQLAVWFLEAAVAKRVRNQKFKSAINRLEQAVQNKVDVDEFEAVQFKMQDIDLRVKNQSLAHAAGEPDEGAADSAGGGKRVVGGKEAASKGEMQKLTHQLGDALASFEGLQTELRTKAVSSDVSSALSAMQKKVLLLQGNIIDRDTLATQLRTKLDRKDLNRIAQMIAAGDLDGMNPTVAAKLQMPNFRCLSCNRPIHSINSNISGSHSACGNGAGEGVAMPPPVSVGAMSSRGSTSTVSELGMDDDSLGSFSTASVPPPRATADLGEVRVPPNMRPVTHAVKSDLLADDFSTVRKSASDATLVENAASFSTHARMMPPPPIKGGGGSTAARSVRRSGGTNTYR